MKKLTKIARCTAFAALIMLSGCAADPDLGIADIVTDDPSQTRSEEVVTPEVHSNRYINGPDMVWSSAPGYSVYSLTPALIYGAHFDGWTITPSGYVLGGPTDNPHVLSVRFPNFGQYTITTHYSYSGKSYTRTKNVTSHRIDIPILTWAHDNLPSTSGWDAKVWMINWQSTVNYEWRVNYSSVFSARPGETWIHVSESMSNNQFIVQCRARIGMAISDWSNPVTVTAP